MSRHRFHLKPQQDGYGYFYGEFVAGEEQHRVDVLPPASWPQPSFVLRHLTKPDPTLWTVFVNGEEVVRLASREDVERALVIRLVG